MGILEELTMTIGERIKFFRTSHKITQKNFAIALGISQTHISKIENNEDNPSETLLHKIAAIGNLNFEWLTTGQGNMTIDDPIDESYTIEQCFYDIKEAGNRLEKNLFNSLLKQIDKLIKINGNIKLMPSLNDTRMDLTVVELLDKLNQIIKYLIYIEMKYSPMPKGSMTSDECKKLLSEINEEFGYYLDDMCSILLYQIPLITAAWDVLDEYILSFYTE